MTKVFRTRVTEVPVAIHRSDNQPPSTDDAAIPQNGNEPRSATDLMVKPRSLIRYIGSHDNKKDQT